MLRSSLLAVVCSVTNLVANASLVVILSVD
jgi:hypothetical protein